MQGSAIHNDQNVANLPTLGAILIGLVSFSSKAKTLLLRCSEAPVMAEYKGNDSTMNYPNNWIDRWLDLLRKTGEPLLTQEDLHAPDTLYERVSG
jgi:hypothetical protein